MSRVSSPTRRVLGEKDANALLNTASPRNTAKAGVGTEKTGSIQARPDIISSRPEILPSSLQAGRKRRINEVEGVEVQDWQESNRLSQLTDIISDSGSELTVPDMTTSSMLPSQSAAYTSMTSIGASQQEQNMLEPQFELPQDEMSQQTLEKIHAVSVPQNTSQIPTYGTHPALITEDTQGSVSMSSLIDFGASDGSQASDGAHPLDSKGRSVEQRGVNGSSTETTTSTGEVTEEDRRKAMMAQKASELRTRLQFAYFKVQTNQTTTPFSRLKVPESMKKADSPQLQASASAQRHGRTHVSRDQRPPQVRRELSPESHVAAMRAQATAQPKPKIKALSSLPMPHIEPTAFSSRYADGQPTPEDERGEIVHIPSSPPLSEGAIRAHTTASYKDGGEQSGQPARLSSSNEQLSSPPPSHHSTEGEDLDITPRAKAQDNDHGAESVNNSFVSTGTTNSAVKGEAADGLVQLMLGRVGSGSVQGMCGI